MPAIRRKDRRGPGMITLSFWVAMGFVARGWGFAEADNKAPLATLKGRIK
jgi:hypothetical protein